MKFFQYFCVLLPVFFWSACEMPSGESGAMEAEAGLESLTGAHTRVVWLQDAWEHEDVFSARGRVRLMALDSRDGRGEQVQIEGPAPLRRPLISPCGQWILYSRNDDGGVWVLGWDSEVPSRLTDGVALAVTDAEEGFWVYVGRAPVDPDAMDAFAEVVRVNAMNGSLEEPVWKEAPVGRDNFQVSPDGRWAGALFPWPTAGLADLETGTWQEMGRGCWTGLAPLEEPLMWILDGAHRNLNMVHGSSGERWQVPVARHEAFGGHEIYHPRWSSHPRILTVSGPYKIRKGGNNIRGGGDSVEIHVGRFAADWRSVEAWVQVTDNAHANFFPDVWVADSGEVTAGPLAEAGSETEERDTTVYTVEARRLEVTPTPSMEDIAPYTQALAAHLYEVLEGPEAMTGEKLLIAHWVIREGETLVDAPGQAGEIAQLRIREYDAVPELEGERLVIDVSNLLLPLYVAED